MAAAAAALAALLSACLAQQATRDLTMVGMCANVLRLDYFDQKTMCACAPCVCAQYISPYFM